ncbi:hypothetical protein JCM3765_007625 [Sporobolomyces pararoseus]
MATNSKGEVPHQEKVLAAQYAAQIKSGKSAQIHLVLKLVRERHSSSSAKLSDSLLGNAKQALIERGALEHITGPTNRLTQGALRGVQSWKQKVGVDPQDDEQAATQYLQHGVKPSTFAAATPSTSKSVPSNKTVSQTPNAQPPSSSTTSVRSHKGKEKEVVSNEEEREGGGGKGTKRGSTGGEGDQSAKKPKLVIDTSKGKAESEKKRKDVSRQGKKNETEEYGEESNSPPGRKKRKTGPAGPGIASLKRTDLIKKIRELEAKIEVGRSEEIEEEGEEEEDEISAKEIENSKALKSGLSTTTEKGSTKEKEKEEDSDELSDLEDSQVEEQIVQKILVPRPESPPIFPPLPSTSTHSPHHRQRAVSADPVPPPQSRVQLSTSSSRRFSDQGGGVAPNLPVLRSPDAVSSHARELIKEVEPKGKNLGGEKEIQAELDVVSHDRRESNSAEKELPGGSKDGKDEEMNEADPGDQTLVEIVEEEIEKKAPVVVQPLPIGGARMPDDKVAAQPIILERPPAPQQQPITEVDRKTLEELADAQEEIAKLRSIRNELARERNDATEEKAELRRKLEKSQHQVKELTKNLQAASENRQAVSEEIKNEIYDLRKKLKADQQTITALNQDISDLETEKESLTRKLELRNSEFETLSTEAVQVQTTLYETRTLLEQATKSNAELEAQRKAASLSITRLEGDLKIAQEDLAQLEEERQNEVEEISKENRAKSEELQTVKHAYDALRLDVLNLGVSCNARIDQSSSPKTIINDLGSRHLLLTQQLSLRDSGTSQAMGVVRSLLEVLSSTRAKPPTPPSQTSTLEDLLNILTGRISDVVGQLRQVRGIANEAGFIKAIADLVIAGGGAEIPTTFSQLPKAIEDVQKALIEKNTAILQLSAELQATQTNLNESNLSHRTLESSLDQIQGELGDTTRRLDYL